ncbi:Transcription factor, MADS-box [Dillenia turbinata]|uniref:Transcription factor, MADS-box n=1 Tax=Dillenia turbinata TaxID=194707 RepID=A0AAN8UQW9_9MAGN
MIISATETASVEKDLYCQERSPISGYGSGRGEKSTTVACVPPNKVVGTTSSAAVDPLAALGKIAKMDLSKTKTVKLPKNSKEHYLAIQRRKKNLFKKASELSTLCGIEVCVIVYYDQKATTASETWPNNHNDVLQMVKRYKGRKSENRENKLQRKDNTILKQESANVKPNLTNLESCLYDAMVMRSQAHFDFSSQMQSNGMSNNILDVHSPLDIMLEDEEFWNNLDESIAEQEFLKN